MGKVSVFRNLDVYGTELDFQPDRDVTERGWNDVLVAEYDTEPEWTINANSYEPEVTSVNERCANIHWGGASAYQKEALAYKLVTRDDTLVLPNGLKVYLSFDKYGNRLVRYWLSDSANVTVRIKTVHIQHPAVAHEDWFTLEVFTNIRKYGRWTGTKRAERNFRNEWNDQSEGRAVACVLQMVDYYAVAIPAN